MKLNNFPKQITKRLQRNEGFTLLEVVLALGLGGLILASVMTLFVTFIQVWNEDKERRAFQDFVDSSVHFLTITLNAPLSTLEGDKSKSTLRWKRLRKTASLRSTWVLAITLRKPPSFLKQSNVANGPMCLYLSHEEDKLFLGWQGRKLVENKFSFMGGEEQGAIEGKFLLSNFVPELRYAYLDAKRESWRFENEPVMAKTKNKQTLPKLPDALKIVLKKDGLEETRYIPITPFSQRSPKRFPNK